METKNDAEDEKNWIATCEDAFGADGYLLTLGDQTVEAWVVDGDGSFEEDGFRHELVTIEGEYDGPDGRGTYIWRAWLDEREPGSGRAEVELYDVGDDISDKSTDEQVPIDAIEPIQSEPDGATITFTDGSEKTYGTVRVKVSGWVLCYDDVNGEKVAYPPRKIEEIRDPKRDRIGNRQGLKTQAPHGRI